MNLKSLTKPTFLVDEVKARENIFRMSQKARASEVSFRPHFKSHFSSDIGNWYKEVGVTGITVSSIDMAAYFAHHGWKDITIAFPVNILEINELNELAAKIALNLVVESLDTLLFLNQNLNHPANIWIKIDTGYARTGINWNNEQKIKKVISAITTPLKFQGLLAHFGHTYKEHEKSNIRKIYNEGVQKLIGLKSMLQIESCLISVGDTPSCSLVDNFGSVNEIRPGNFIFYDLMQKQIGSCSIDQISVCMACPVVAIHSDRNELVIHGGAVHFSKDFILNQQGQAIYGRVTPLLENGWSHSIQEEVFLKSVSQEHGIITATDEFISQSKVGDVLGILPVHSCLTANLMKDYVTLEGKVLRTMNSIS